MNAGRTAVTGGVVGLGAQWFVTPAAAATGTGGVLVAIGAVEAATHRP